jgi:hypothetical protein
MFTSSARITHSFYSFIEPSNDKWKDPWYFRKKIPQRLFAHASQKSDSKASMSHSLNSHLLHSNISLHVCACFEKNEILFSKILFSRVWKTYPTITTKSVLSRAKNMIIIFSQMTSTEIFNLLSWCLFLSRLNFCGHIFRNYSVKILRASLKGQESENK